MRKAARAAIAAVVIGSGGAIGCGGTAGETAAESPASGSAASTSGGDTAAAESPATTWLATVPEGGTLTYEVTLRGGAARQVRMQVQQVVRRGSAIAARLAPVGTPLDDEPVYPRWIVGEESVLAGLDETAALTEPGYTPIDESGRMRTEAADNIAWRLPRDWLTPGRAVPGEEVSAGWTLSERVGDVTDPIAAHDCVRLAREEAGEREVLLVCGDVGLVESTTSDGSGTVGEAWRLVAIEAAPDPTDDDAAEMH